MIGKLNHIAIAVPDLISASEIYKNILGASVSDLYQYQIMESPLFLLNYLIQKLSYLNLWEMILQSKSIF